MNNTVPFLDLVTQHRELEEDLVAVFRDALRTGRFIGGPQVEEFEREFADYCGARRCVGVGSGTDALRFALMAAGIRPGDIVVTVPNTFIATTEAISQTGARPAFVDIDKRTCNMDVGKLREYLEEHCYVDDRSGRPISRLSRRPVTAVVPVHLYGQTADMDPILELAKKYRLAVIEDACQAHGAEYYSRQENRWRKAGSMGLAAAFSFYPGKNLGACGEAGAVTTSSDEIARKVSMLRDHGQIKKYHHEIEGYNGRLDAIQAGILRLKLRHLPEWNARRRQLAYRYNYLLAPIGGIMLPAEPQWAKSAYHLYVVRSRKRDELQTFLAARGIGTGLHYPVPLHLQKAYECMPIEYADLRASEKAAREVLSLPLFPGMTEEQQIRVAGCIHEFIETEQTAGARPGRPAAMAPAGGEAVS